MTSALRTASASERDQRPSDRPPEGEGAGRQKSLRFSLAPVNAMDQPEWERRVERFISAVVRGAGAGFCLRGGLNLAALLFALLARRQQAQRSKRGSLAEQLRDTLRYTSFLGAFAGVYVAADEGIAAMFGNKRTSRWRAAVAGGAAAPTILLTGRETRHTSLALYVLIRGITLLVRIGNKADAPPLLRRLLAPTRWRHGDTALMCLSTSQIGYSWIMRPSTLPPAYINFLNRHGGAPVHHYRAVQELAQRNEAGQKPGPLALLQGTPQAGFQDRIPCGFLHEGLTCNENFVRFLPLSYLRSLPVYIPVYLLPAVLVHRQRLLFGPRAAAIWVKAIAAAARSSLFLAAYCTFAWRGACAGHQLTGTSTGAVLAASCWTGGLSTLLEKKSRRMELAFYCLSRAVESFALCLKEWGWVRRDALPRRTDVILFAAATAAIMHCYSDDHGTHREVFRSKYLNVLDFVFGNTGLEKGSIKHVPSNSDIAAMYVPERVAADARRAASGLGSALQADYPDSRSDDSDSVASFSRGYSQALQRPPSSALLSSSSHISADQGP